jgi:hypothetical protein
MNFLKTPKPLHMDCCNLLKSRIWLILTLIFGLGFVNSHAQTLPITVGSVSGAVGSDVTINVTTNADLSTMSLYNIGLAFTYDPSVIFIYGSTISGTMYGQAGTTLSSSNPYYDNVKSFQRGAARATSGTPFSTPTGGVIITLNAKIVGTGSTSVTPTTTSITAGITPTFSAGIITANPGTGLTATLPTVTGAPGATLPGTVTLSNINNYGVKSYQFRLEYNSAHFELNNFAVNTTNFPGASEVPNVTYQTGSGSTKYAVVQGFLSETAAQATGSGVLLTYDIVLNGSAIYSNSPITVVTANSYLDDVGAPPVAFTNGSVTSSTGTPPTVTTSTATGVGTTTATLGGNITSGGSATVTASGVCYSISTAPTTASTCVNTSPTTTSGAFTGNATGLTPNTLYYVRAYATNSAGTSYGNEVTFTTISTANPSVTTGAVTNIFSTTATVAGTLVSWGSGTPTAMGICYGTDPEPTTPCVTASGTATGAFSVNLTGLTAGEDYFARAYATSSEGTVYGDDVEFSTIAAATSPTVTTTAATSVTSVAATTGGNVTAQGSTAVTARGVCYATTANPDLDDDCVAASAGGAGAFSVNLTGLTPSTTYNIRAYATNGSGTSYGSNLTFQTGVNTSIPPTVTTVGVSGVTSSSATVGGNITNIGSSAITSKGVCYATSADAPSPTCVQSLDPSNSFSVTLTGLSASTTYFVRAFATNSEGTGNGNQQSFATLAFSNPIPNITTITPSSSGTGVTNVSVILTGTNFLAGPTYTTSAFVTGSGVTIDSTKVISSTQINLKISVASNATAGDRSIFVANPAPGGGSSTPVTFTVNSPASQSPTVTTSAVTNLGSTTVTLGGDVTNSGTSTVTTRGVCYATTQNPTTSNTCVNPSPMGTTGSFSVNVSGLTATTTYYARAFATNASGTAYGSQVTFTTTTTPNPVPTVTSISPNSGAPGTTVNVTITGTGFVNGATVQSGAGITASSVTFVSSTSITASFAIGAAATFGIRNITVTNPTPGGGTSNAVTFSVALPPPTPNPTSWPAGTVVKTPTKPVFSWVAVTGASTYTIQVSNQSNFTSPKVACDQNCGDEVNNFFIFTSTNLTGTSWTYTQTLEPNSTYYWRIRSNTATVNGNYSNPIQFEVVNPPSAPALVAPSNGAIVATGSSVNMSWTSTSNTTTYQLQVSTSFDFSTLPLINETALTAANYTTPILAAGSAAQYYWRVRSVGPGGTGEWSDTRTYVRQAGTNLDAPGEMPTEYSLEQNYPNPFNPSTNISFSLPETANVTLEVYNLQGQLVASLLNNMSKSAGRHSISFDASALSSGVYVYRITAGSFMSTKKMSLLK